MWLEHTARRSRTKDAYPFPFADSQLDFRPLLRSVAHDRARGHNIEDIARAFQRGIAAGLLQAADALARAHQLDITVVSGGVFQNELLVEDLKPGLQQAGLEFWTNQSVPPNDGGISLGQAAIAALKS
jgi:hydrogenase maturation protein HypF